jgi:uroporphyrinogen decarboxylase
MNQKFQNALKRIPQKTPPIWFMRQAGRYHQHYQGLRKNHSFSQLCKTPELAAQTALGPIMDFDFDVSILFSDILFPLEALGMGLSYEDGPPKLGFSLNPETISRLKHWEECTQALQFQGEAMKATRAVLPNDKSLIGFVGGPWTLFVYAVDGSHHGSLSKSKSLAPSLLAPFFAQMVPLLQWNIEQQLKGGAEAVMILDTASGELSPQDWETHIAPTLSQLIGKFPGRVGYYGKGLTEGHLATRALQDKNLAGLGIDHRFDFASVLGSRKDGFVQGNFDQTLLFLDEKNFELRAREYLNRLKEANRDGWVAGLGHGVLPNTPEKNVRRFVGLVREIF